MCVCEKQVYFGQEIRKSLHDFTSYETLKLLCECFVKRVSLQRSHLNMIAGMFHNILTWCESK